MIRIITDQGTYDVPGTAKDVDYEKNLKIIRNGQVTCVFRSWIHWIEIED
ncbi:hypothetical protein [Paeniglutamicibacter cryotolerans]|uniref:Uncharacterized protein n=1 Tax=Paeniglutamicibacter cryotolerans TaxID=670079 RepID=A0A839QRN1_9MICC|nr:hypothetical protein [Paeniglutamicibacter cryotolerans]MBB2995912.1 hypothetical protein [Paeniglutamicibacter cryotolerans]